METALISPAEAKFGLEPNLYIPKHSTSLADSKPEQIRLGLQGASGTGKTFAALTFPNPVVANFDRGLIAHHGRTDVIDVPFYSEDFQRKFCTNANAVNARDALTIWLKQEAKQLTKNQTLILDSWTHIQDAFDKQTEFEPVRTKTGGIDEYAFWARKMDWSRDLLMSIKDLRCHVVVAFHELSMRDDKGNLLQKIQPLMQGKFINKIPSYFTDFFRQCVFDELDSEKKPIYEADGKTKKVNWWWQIRSDSIVDLKTRMKDVKTQFIKADYKSFNY